MENTGKSYNVNQLKVRSSTSGRKAAAGGQAVSGCRAIVKGDAKMAGRQKGGKGKSIQSRLVLLLLSILVPVLVIQAYMYYDSYRTRRASELQSNLEIARAVANTFESFVEDVLHHERVIGLAVTSSQSMTPGDITRLLTSSQGDVAVRDFTWLNPNGTQFIRAILPLSAEITATDPLFAILSTAVNGR